MKELHELNLPEDIHYSEDHEWARSEDGKIKVGISDYAQDQLGDITFVELPEEGAAFKRGSEFGTVESTKAVSELLMPIGGEILRINTDLEESPGLVNQDPYGRGWIIEVAPDNPAEMDALMNAGAYRKLLEGMD